MRRSQSLAQTNLSRSLGDGNQHNVDDPDRSQPKRHQSHDPEKIIHGIKNLSHANCSVDSVPVHECVIEAGIKTMASRHDGMYLILGFNVQLFFCRSVVEK